MARIDIVNAICLWERQVARDTHTNSGARSAIAVIFAMKE